MLCGQLSKLSCNINDNTNTIGSQEGRIFFGCRVNNDNNDNNDNPITIPYLYKMQKTITISTNTREGLFDITSEVEAIVIQSKIAEGLVNVYAQGATAAIMVQENWDDSVQMDVVNLLKKLIPKGVWLHDAQDGNGDSHLKAGIIGPSETIPIINGKLGLSTWQNIFFCEFDGPRSERKIVVSIME